MSFSHERPRRNPAPSGLPFASPIIPCAVCQLEGRIVASVVGVHSKWKQSRINLCPRHTSAVDTSVIDLLVSLHPDLKMSDKAPIIRKMLRKASKLPIEEVSPIE